MAMCMHTDMITEKDALRKKRGMLPRFFYARVFIKYLLIFHSGKRQAIANR